MSCVSQLLDGTKWAVEFDSTSILPRSSMLLIALGTYHTLCFVGRHGRSSHTAKRTTPGCIHWEPGQCPTGPCSPCTSLLTPCIWCAPLGPYGCLWSWTVTWILERHSLKIAVNNKQLYQHSWGVMNCGAVGGSWLGGTHLGHLSFAAEPLISPGAPSSCSRGLAK